MALGGDVRSAVPRDRPAVWRVSLSDLGDDDTVARRTMLRRQEMAIFVMGTSPGARDASRGSATRAPNRCSLPMPRLAAGFQLGTLPRGAPRAARSARRGPSRRSSSRIVPESAPPRRAQVLHEDSRTRETSVGAGSCSSSSPPFTALRAAAIPTSGAGADYVLVEDQAPRRLAAGTSSSRDAIGS